MDVLAQTYFGDILHAVSQSLLLPAVVALIALILYGLWCVGSILVEQFTEHRHFKVAMPALIEAVCSASCADLPGVIARSGLIGKQKRALLTLWDYRCLPVDSHVALAKRLMEEEDDLHNKIVSRTQTVSKIAPMLGLMGTLIPLGPGIYALGMNDTTTLSSSLLIAFDTTVAGLVVSLVTYVITKIRHRWYENYMTALEAVVTAMLEKVDGLRQAGEFDVSEPTNTVAEWLPSSGKKTKGKSVSARTAEASYRAVSGSSVSLQDGVGQEA